MKVQFFNRKILFSLLVVVMCLGFTAMSYGRAVISVVPTEVASPAAGEELMVGINIVGGANVAGYQVTVNFDPTALSYVSSANGDYLPAGAFPVPPEVGDSSVTIAAASLTGAAAATDGTLATVTFMVVEAKASAITLTNVAISDAAASSLAVTSRDGAVNIIEGAETAVEVPDEALEEEPVVEAPAEDPAVAEEPAMMSSGQAVVFVVPAEVASPAAGEELMVSISIAGGAGVAGYQVTVNFDPTALSYVSSANGDYLPAGAFPIPGIPTDSSVQLAAAAVGATSDGDGTLATVTFMVVEAKASAITLTNVAISDAAASSLAVTSRDGAVNIIEGAETAVEVPDEALEEEPVVEAPAEDPAVAEEPAMMSSGQAVVFVVPAEVASPAAGEELMVSISIAGGAGVAGYLVTVNFDSTALSYVSGENADYLPAGAFPIVTPGEGSVTIAATSLTGPAAAAAGTLATVTFTVVEAKASAITLTAVVLADAAASSLAVTSRDGAVNTTESELPSMYWIDTSSNRLYRSIETTAKNIVPSVENATSIAVHAGGEKVYWTEKTGGQSGKIRRANLDGSNVELVKELTSLPRELTVDTVRNKLYLTNSWGKIQRMNFDGSGFRPNLITGLNEPKHLAVDVSGGKVYWTEPGSIWRADLNSKNREQLLTDLGELGGLAIANGRMYWTERNKHNQTIGRVRRATLTGSHVTTLATLMSVPMGIAVDTAGRKLYWTNSRGRIQRATLTGKHIQNVVAGLGMPATLVLGTAPEVGNVPAAPAALALLSEKTGLLPNYPNPFNPETWLPYQLATAADVTLTIYAANGAVVRVLDLGHRAAGIYSSRSSAAYWDGRNAQGEPVASGIYFYTLTAGDFSATKKMVIRK